MVASNAKILLGMRLGLEGKNEVMGIMVYNYLFFPILQVFCLFGFAWSLGLQAWSCKLHAPKENVINEKT